MTVELEYVVPVIPDELAAMLRSLPPLGAWVDRAACARVGDGADVFTADRPDPDDLELATRTCRRCPVRAECASYDADARPTFGLWAGRWRGTGPSRRF